MSALALRRGPRAIRCSIIEEMLLITDDGAETLAGAALPRDLIETPA
jgi:hypothetical protein